MNKLDLLNFFFTGFGVGAFIYLCVFFINFGLRFVRGAFRFDSLRLED